MTTAMVTTSPMVRQYSLEEFWTLPAPAEGGHYELIAGVLYMVPPPNRFHGDVASRLNLIFAAYMTAHPDRGRLFVPRMAVWTQSDTYLEPDLFLVTKERLDAVAGGDFTAADLVVEVLSPSSAMYDRTAKTDTYAALGVRELWLVDLEKESIEQRVLVDGRWDVRGMHAGSTAVEAVTFPGLCVVPAEAFGRERS